MSPADSSVRRSLAMTATIVLLAVGLGVMQGWLSATPKTAPRASAKIVEATAIAKEPPPIAEVPARRTADIVGELAPDSSSVLSVKVVNGLDDQPIDGAEVEYGATPGEVAATTRSKVTTGRDGVAKLPGVAADGWLLVERTGFIPELAPARQRVAAAKPAEAVVRLHPVIQQRVVVVDQASRPIEGAVVRLIRSWGNEAELLEGPSSESIRASLIPAARTDASGIATLVVRAGARYQASVEILGYVQKISDRALRECNGTEFQLRVHEVAASAVRYPQALLAGKPVAHDMGLFLFGWAAHGPLKELGSEKSGFDYDDRMILKLRKHLEALPGIGSVDQWKFAAVEEGELNAQAVEDQVEWRLATDGAEPQVAKQRFRLFREFSAADVVALEQDYEVEAPGTLSVRFLGYPEELINNFSWLTSWEVKRFGSDMHTVVPSSIPDDRRVIRGDAGSFEFRFKLFPGEYMVTSGYPGCGTCFFEERRVKVLAGELSNLVIQPDRLMSRLLRIRVTDELGRERRGVVVSLAGRGGIRVFEGTVSAGLAPLFLEAGHYRVVAGELQSLRTSGFLDLELTAGDELQELVIPTEWGAD